MKIVNSTSKYTGVRMQVLNGKDFYWQVRVQRKKLKFQKRFPFTPRFEQIAGETYKRKVNELSATQ